MTITLKPVKKQKKSLNKDDIVLEDEEDIEDMLPEYANDDNKKFNQEIW